MQLFANNATSTLTGSITNVATSVTIQSGDAVKFPSPTGGDFFLVTLFQKLGATEANHEIVKCTARASNVLTIVRAQEGTLALPFSTNDSIELRETAGTLASKASLDGATFTGTVSGITAAMVGAPAGSGTSTGINTGDETAITIRSKLSITTLSGSNTGDQVLPTTLPASDVYAWAKAAVKPAYTKSEVGLTNVDNTADSAKSVSYSATSGTSSSCSGNANTVTFAFATGTRLPFAQSAAPTGWTQDVSDNATNRMLRVVNTAGNGIGGSASPILNNVVPAHTHGFTTGNVSADHAHAVSDPGHTHTTGRSSVLGSSAGSGSNFAGTNFMSYASGSSVTGISLGGISANHTHSGSTDNGSSQTNWAPRYIDMIICSKN